MNKLYNGPTWHNNTNPALNETNLNILGQAVDDIDDRVIAIAGTVMETVPQVQEDLAEAQELLEDAEAINSHPPIIGQNGNWWTWDTSTNAYVDSGKDASVTVSVNPNTETLPAGSNAYVQNVGTSTDPVLLFGIPKGDKGETGGATPGSDISGTVVDTITASTAEYPEIAASDTMKVITGKIKKFLDDLKTKKADKVTSATNGHLAGLDSNGNLTDSGKSSSAVIPSGGTTGQVLKKSSGTDYAVEWGTASSGGHTILNGSGSAMNQRGKLQFVGGNVKDDSTNDKTVVTVARELTQAQYDALSSAEKNNGTTYYITDAPSSYISTPQTMMGDAWVTNHTYKLGDYCISDNTLYKCKTAHTSSASYKPPYASYWDAVTVASQLIGTYAKRLVSKYSNSGTTRTLNLSNSTYKYWRQESWNGFEGALKIQLFGQTPSSAGTGIKYYEYWVGGDYGGGLRWAFYASSEGVSSSSNIVQSITFDWSTAILTITFKSNPGGCTVIFELAPYEESQ